MSLGVDTKRAKAFIDAVENQTLNEGIVAGDVRRLGLLEKESREQIMRLWSELLKRADGRLVHRYERRIHTMGSVCYQNSARPRIAIVFLHGYDGSPYDFTTIVAKFFEKFGTSINAIWICLAGPVRSRPLPSFVIRTPISQPNTPTSPILPQHDPAIIESPFKKIPNDEVSRISQEEILLDRANGIDWFEEIDPSGGYQWWPIPVLNFLSGKRTFRTFALALRQNLRTPSNFTEIRHSILITLRYISGIYEIPLSQIYLGGFSQGAMLAGDVIASSDCQLAGTILLSGAPIGRSDHRQLQKEAKLLKKNRLFGLLEGKRMIHKRDDENCPKDRRSRRDGHRRGTSRSEATERSRSEEPGKDASGESANSRQIKERSVKDELVIGALLNTARLSTPLFLSHGTRDRVVPFPFGKYLKRHLSRLGFHSITFETFSGGHDVPEAVGDALFQWFLTTSPIRALSRRHDPHDTFDQHDRHDRNDKYDRHFDGYDDQDSSGHETWHKKIARHFRHWKRTQHPQSEVPTQCAKSIRTQAPKSYRTVYSRAGTPLNIAVDETAPKAVDGASTPGGRTPTGRSETAQPLSKSVFLGSGEKAVRWSDQISTESLAHASAQLLEGSPASRDYQALQTVTEMLLVAHSTQSVLILPPDPPYHHPSGSCRSEARALTPQRASFTPAPRPASFTPSSSRFGSFTPGSRGSFRTDSSSRFGSATPSRSSLLFRSSHSSTPSLLPARSWGGIPVGDKTLTRLNEELEAILEEIDGNKATPPSSFYDTPNAQSVASSVEEPTPAHTASTSDNTPVTAGKQLKVQFSGPLARETSIANQKLERNDTLHSWCNEGGEASEHSYSVRRRRYI